MRSLGLARSWGILALVATAFVAPLTGAEQLSSASTTAIADAAQPTNPSGHPNAGTNGGTVAASDYYTLEDFSHVEKIDAHVHLHGAGEHFMAQAIQDNF